VPIRHLGRIVPAALVVALSSVARAAPAVSETPVTLDAGGGVQLSGTLATPSGRGPFPVALIIAGSGPTDRDGNNPQRYLFRASVQPYLISWYKYDPAVEIAKLTIPVLIVQGTTDLHVNVTGANRLATADPRVKLAIIQGMNHVFRVAPADRAKNIETYNDPTLPLDPQAVSTIADFLLAP
jgi:fermentation-respiration switch protein FrsA (DUF1100 family)